MTFTWKPQVIHFFFLHSHGKGQYQTTDNTKILIKIRMTVTYKQWRSLWKVVDIYKGQVMINNSFWPLGRHYLDWQRFPWDKRSHLWCSLLSRCVYDFFIILIFIPIFMKFHFPSGIIIVREVWFIVLLPCALQNHLFNCSSCLIPLDYLRW